VTGPTETREQPTALDAVLPDLACPVCRSALARHLGSPHPGTRHPGSVGCASGHRFDLARQGYLSLLAGRRGAAAGDDAAMVAARQAILHAGHYTPLTSALVEAAAPALRAAAAPEPVTRGPLVIDVGAGTGHHLAAVLDSAPTARGLAIDVSAPALRGAAHAHPRAAAVGADVWAGLPLRDGAADVVLDAFSPRNGPEFARVLTGHGRLVVAVPDADHLAGLVEPLGLIGVDPDKGRRLAENLADAFDVVSERHVTWVMRLTRAEAATLVAMTPSARHVTSAAVEAGLRPLADPVEVRAAVRVYVAAPRPPRAMSDTAASSTPWS